MHPILPRLALALAAVLIGGSALAAEPVLTSIDFDTLTRSGRFMVRGSNLDQAGQIHISGVPAIGWPIPGTNAVAMVGFVPEDMPYGAALLTVTTAGGTSNALPVTVVPRKPDGRKLWRALLNNQLMIWRPALGSDGTIYARSQAGDVTAITPHGARKWMLQLGPDLTPQIDIGPDDTIYTAFDSTVYAIRPDGTVKWTFTDPTSSQGVIAGPNVGPDGNIYVVTHLPGLGIFSLDPQGALRWSGPDQLLYAPFGQIGQEIVFSDTQLFFCQDEVFDSFRFDGEHVFRTFTLVQTSSDSPQPAVGPNGDSYVEEWAQLRSHAPDGDLNWKVFGAGGSYLRDPDVGADGTIYVMRNVFNTLHAVNPDGSERWTYNHPYMLLNVSVAPSDERIVVGGAGVGLEQPRFFLALDTDGQPLWTVDLPGEQLDPWTVTFPAPQGRARWTPDSSVAYTMAAGPAWSGGHSYLYALQVAPIVELEHALAGSAGEPRLAATGSLEAGSPCTVDLTLARPRASCWFVVGTEALAVPFRSGVLLPRPDVVLPVQTDAAGAVQLAFTWPAGFLPDQTVYVQAWIDDPAGPKGLSASNALSLITP